MILKLKQTPGIYLVGFMAAGKTTIGRLLADRLGWHFVDLDDDIEAAEGTTIARIFETRGEEEFRRAEHAAMRARIKAIECGRPTVVALGGGAFVQPENYALLENNGITVWLDCPFEMVCRRVEQSSHRPLARDPEQFEHLYQSRQEAYSRADYRIAIDSDDPAAAVDAVMRLPLFK
ncbi:MAG: shikimate kinase [Bryobacteraceae bacterium]